MVSHFPRRLPLRGAPGVLFWSPQIVAIAFVYLLGFRKTTRRA
jgi:hypothetical protein